MDGRIHERTGLQSIIVLMHLASLLQTHTAHIYFSIWYFESVLKKLALYYLFPCWVYFLLNALDYVLKMTK